MNWEEFVKGESVAVHTRGHNYALFEAANQAIEKNTLANWVRETNNRLAKPKQLTLRFFA